MHRCLTLLFICSSLWAGNTREFTRAFTVEAGRPSLEIDVSAAQIDLRPGPEGQVTVTIMQSIPSAEGSDADSIFDEWAFDFSQQGGRISLRAGSRKSMVWDWDPVRRMQCAIVVTAPVASDLRLLGRNLRINLDELDGKLSVDMDGGSLFAQRVSGDVSVRADSGQVTLSSAGGKVDLKMETGHMLIGTASGPVKVDSSGGLLDIQQADDVVKVRGNTLDVVVGLANPFRADCDVRTSAGSITLKVEQTADLLIDAKAPWLGEVKARGLDFDVKAGRVGSSRLLAQLNDGGPRVLLRASGGIVSIIGLEPLGLPVASLAR